MLAHKHTQTVNTHMNTHAQTHKKGRGHRLQTTSTTPLKLTQINVCVCLCDPVASLLFHQKLLFALAAAASCSHVSVAVRFGGEWREQLFLWLKTFRGLHMWKGGAPFLLSPLSLLLFGGSLPPSFFVWDAPTRERRRREGEGIQPDRQRSRAGGHQENKP